MSAWAAADATMNHKTIATERKELMATQQQ
jgi:hypothetical protein